jgi:tetratricopeptide (TPR) repeat protein
METSKNPALRPRLSVAMIVRNEQDVLAESIASVRPIAEEVVVLDTGSTDQTVDTARRLGAVVAEAAWTDDFSAARNRCLEMVSGDWVLWLDAGERLAEESAAELRKFVDREADPEKLYMLLVQVPPPDTIASGEQVAQPRLIPNRADLRFQGRVRETLRPSLEAAGLRVETAPGRIIRHRRQHDLAVKTLKAHRDLKLAALEIAEMGRSSLRLLLAIGEAYSNLGLQDQARTTFQQAIQAAEKGSSEMLEAYYGLLTALEGDPFFSDLQLNVCLEALEVFPVDAQLLLALGNYLQKQQRLELATRAFDTAVKYGQVDLTTWHLTELAEVAAVCLNLILQMRDLDDEACRVLTEALGRHPRSLRILRHLVDLHVKHGRCQQALEAADRLPLEPNQRKSLRTAVQGACKAAQKDWPSALEYLESAYLGGCHDPFVLRWLSIAYLSRGQLDAARPILTQWCQLEPNNGELQSYLTVVGEYSEAARADQAPTEKQTADDSEGRKLRIDPGILAYQAAPPQLPIVSQVSSAEAPA